MAEPVPAGSDVWDTLTGGDSADDPYPDKR
jgi:hypothetical protein